MRPRSWLVVAVATSLGCGTLLDLSEDGPTPGTEVNNDGGDGASDSSDSSDSSDPASDAASDGPKDGAADGDAAATAGYIFLTSAKYNSGIDFHSVAEADGLCKTIAESNGSLSKLNGRQWRAWLSDS